MSANSDLHLNSDPEKVDLSQGAGEIRDELLQYFEGQPFLRTQGMEVEQLDGEVQDPSGIVETNLDEIAATTGIPKNELRGNQQGEVSGAEQDAKSYFGMIKERRRQYATPHIVRPLIQRLIDVGVLPTPENGTFEVEWPDLTQLSELEESKVQVNRAQVLRQAGPVVDIGADYLRDGDIPEEGEQTTELPNPEDATPEMQAQFANEFDLADNQSEVKRVPPETAQENAEKVLRWREEHPDEINGMTEVGWKRAKQLAAGEELSNEDIKSMAQFNRHRKNAEVADEFKGEPWKDAGHVAWLGWGGDTGVNWAIRQSDKLTSNESDESESLRKKVVKIFT
jgi:hypothetical protein